MTEEQGSSSTRCQLCRGLIRDVLHRTIVARMPRSPVENQLAQWEVFVTWNACAACANMLQEARRDELLLRTYHLRKPEHPADIRPLTYYRYQFYHFCVPVQGSDFDPTLET